MAKYLIDTISTFRIRYAVEAETEDQARMILSTNIGNSTFNEFSQNHLGELVADMREIDDAEYLVQFDKDNDYLKSWTDEQKFSFLNK